MKTRLISLILSFCMFGSLLTGCGKSADPNQVVSSQSVTYCETGRNQKSDVEAVKSDVYLREKLTVVTGTDSGSFDPFFGFTFGGVELGLFQKLAYEDSSGKLRLCVLKSCEKMNELTYKLELWDLIYDSAGNHITAEDVLWSVKHYISVGHAGAINRLERLEISDEYTLIWHSNAPMGPGELERNLSSVPVVSRAAWDSAGTDGMASNPIGTGPYLLREYVVTSHVTLEANENFWMKNITDEEWLEKNDYALNYQNVRTIQINVVPDASVRAIAVEKGIADVADIMNASDVALCTANPSSGVAAVDLFVRSPVSVYFNCSDDSLCASIDLRKAICYAIDNASIAQGLSSRAYPVYGIQPNVFDAPELWLSGREYYDYDPDKALELLARADCEGETLVLAYRSSVQAFFDVSVQLQSVLKNVGIKLELLPIKDSQMDEYTTDLSKWDLMMDVSGGGNYCVSTLNLYWTQTSAETMNGWQVTGIVDETLDELYLAIKNENSAESIEAWDNYFNEQCYAYAICGYYNQTACRNTVCAVAVGENLIPGAFTYYV